MRLTHAALLAVTLLCSTGNAARAQAAPADLIARHPAAGAMESAIKLAAAPFQDDTRLTRADYLPLIAGNVDFFKQHQNAAGAIIDPYEKAERQYSTPAFALSAAILVRDLKRDDLLDPATRAMSFALAALASRTTADNHADFYIPLLMHTRRLLKDRVAPDLLQKWDDQLRALVPERAYRETTARNNWNLVNVCGECLRRNDGLVAPDQLASQQAYLDRSLLAQSAHFSRFGMFEDPNYPLAYDVFPRLWLEDVLADGAYRGEHLQRLSDFLTLGGLSTLLLVSPSGEWACGGRSADHQWNEAAVAVIAECNAARWHAAGRDDLAGMFKRAAHLSLASLRRWQRPSGELWVVKNFADPAQRLGYETYSFHSQYNLLPMAMLAIAHERADDSIAERPIPAEAGSYVFDLRSPFHKVAAAAAGTSLLIDTDADPHYNATGLQRVHARGVALSPLSDSAAPDRAYAPATGVKQALAPGLQWRTSPQDTWHSLSDGVQSCDLSAVETPPASASFALRYTTRSGLTIQENWQIDRDGVTCAQRLSAKSPPLTVRFVFPALLSDGARDTTVKTNGSGLTIERSGGALALDLLAPANLSLALDGPAIPTHIGMVRAAAADLPADTDIRWRIRLSPTAK